MSELRKTLLEEKSRASESLFPRNPLEELYLPVLEPLSETQSAKKTRTSENPPRLKPRVAILTTLNARLDVRRGKSGVARLQSSGLAGLEQVVERFIFNPPRYLAPPVHALAKHGRALRHLAALDHIPGAGVAPADAIEAVLLGHTIGTGLKVRSRAMQRSHAGAWMSSKVSVAGSSM